MKRLATWLLILALLVLAAIIVTWPRQQMIASPSPAALAATPQTLARGAMLARAGDCVACHTATGGAPFAGGRLLATPFGAVAAPNITPDRATGIGAWSADDFWNALHNGVGRGGRLLYPAFPYTNYTRVTREDADALYTWLRSQPAVRQANRAHQLRFPYDSQAALAAWRLLYFKPAVFVPTQGKSADWNRGAYLVEGLGHCSACHASRNAAGASAAGLGGGLIPVLDWYAPSLSAADEAGLAGWPVEEAVTLLKSGIAPHAVTVGPMAEVVQRSLQYLDDADVAAMVVYLQALPPTTPARPAASAAAADAGVEPFLAQGKQLYEHHCIDCHGRAGEGAPPAYPALAGNRAVTMASAVNPIRLVLHGGFPPGTAGNPRPYGMPPFGQVLKDGEIAAIVSYVRASWGNHAGVVEGHEVGKYRAID